MIKHFISISEWFVSKEMCDLLFPLVTFVTLEICFQEYFVLLHVLLFSPLVCNPTSDPYIILCISSIKL